MSRIVALHWGRIEAPLRVPFKTSVRQVSTLVDFPVIIEANDGRQGLGSAPPTAKVTGHTEGAILGAYAEIAAALIGRDADDLAENLRALSHSIVANSSAKAAVDGALHDLWAKGLGVPLWKALGGSGGSVETNVTISVNAPDVMAKDSLDAIGRGFRTLKTKVGLDPEVDLQRLTAIRQAVGKDVTLRIDANQGWNARQALRMLDAMQEKDLDIELVEQPVPAWDLKGLAEVARQSPVPVVADESCWTADQARRLMDDSPVWPNIKLMKCGGLAEAKRIVALAEIYGREVMLGSMLEGKISVSVAVALALCRGVATRLDLDGPALVVKDDVVGGPEFNGPKISAWEGPGLGLAGVTNFQLLGGSGVGNFDASRFIVREG
ncbi:enolase superfamily enzyme related to L-alanine-DL-glutamate epimerase [Jonquetella anthropi DSM 22815]|uniref:Dipeptide epimerase n=1 Tax=Jonquetella anthropi DSM 22815 TaxID=885272 RepID=H0UJN5_9BACT|nr:dipeptide epimerase [Jonquetella anthropi]EEX48890.1 mandelate racemase/muconate lactonizing enzyme, C-terminal domain protein [Jonquetella anthropi E3_33 E1]EHM12903.1 enolase superfamily enzyme related to L-alanine-DL-glutamate epimerase [Jonquetella anthropi DSM 22815]